MDKYIELEKEIANLKGFFQGKGYNQSLLALNFAKEKHEGQFRQTGEPYISHPIRVCSYLRSLGIRDDNTFASALLHDVEEDCKVSVSDLQSYGFNIIVTTSVDVLSKKKGQTIEDYYEVINKTILFEEKVGIIVALVKLSDRCHNVSTMADAFTFQKIGLYIQDTNINIRPLYKMITRRYPQYADQAYAMRDNLDSLISVYELCLKGV